MAQTVIVLDRFPDAGRPMPYDRSVPLRLLVGRHPRRTLLRVAALTVTATVVFGWVLIPLRAEGVSMQPTLEPGGLHLVNRLAFRWHDPARTTIVAIRLAGLHVLYVKRIVGLPGERVRIAGGQVFVDDRPLDEPYVRHRNPDWALPETTLGPDEFFVVGDNRGMRIDDHELGKVRRARIVGALLF
jgi:signal peptidase I